MAVEMKKGIYWVGIVDWGIRHFHGHELSTNRGTTYNAFLVKDKKTALIDTVWAPFRDDFIRNVTEVTDLSAIDYIVVNHCEPDHSGTLPAIKSLCPNAELVVSKRGADSVPGHYHSDWNMRVVKTGDSISLGTKDLVFVEAQMLHWPDTMFTYVTDDNVFMTSDAFGQHYATGPRFNDEVDSHELYEEALKYYANIVAPYSDRVLKKIDEVLGMNLPVDIIAPSHGVMWRDNPMQIVETYRKWAEQKPKTGAVILYDTMWEATRRMADAVAEGFVAEGVPVKVFRMSVADRNDAIAEVFKAKAVVIGSPTYNRLLLPTIMPVIEELKGLKFKNRIGASFGSYGWSGECTRLIEEHLKQCGVEIVAEGVKAKWQPDSEALAECRQLGAEVASAVKQKTRE